MIHNHILDALRGRVTYPGLFISPSVDRKGLARLIRDAEVFDFGTMLLQENHNKEGYWLIPELTPEEESFFAEGLIPLPADVCWYEFELNGHNSALLVVKSKDKLEVMRIDFTPGPNHGGIDGISVERNKPDNSQFVLTGDVHYLKLLQDHGEMDYLQSSFAGSYRLMEYMTLMLNSKTTEKKTIERKHSPEARAHNRHPLPAHRVVIIVPKHFRDAADREAGTGAGTHKRLHWRRSHLREYKAPSGAVYHRVVIPRHLVGREELGEVTHTYKIKHD